MQYLQSQVADSVLVSFMHTIALINDTAYLLCTRLTLHQAPCAHELL